MAAITVPTWAHAGLPDAAKFNQISTALTAIHDTSGDASRQAGARFSSGGTIYQLMATNGHSLRHFYRYLLYSGSGGTIEDPAAVGEAVTLADVVPPTLFDLRNVPWMFYGKFYRVEGDGLTWCMEVNVLLI